MKKVLIGILSLIMILGLVGCSSTTGDKPSSFSSSGQYSNTLERIYSIVKERGEAHYNGDINNPLIDSYDYRPDSNARIEEITIGVDEKTGQPEYFSYNFFSDDYFDESMYVSNIWYSMDFVLYADGTTNYRINYFRARDKEPIFLAEIDDIENSTYKDASSKVEISNYGIHHMTKETPEIQRLIYEGLYRDYQRLNTRMSELFSVSLKDWGYSNFR